MTEAFRFAAVKSLLDAQKNFEQIQNQLAGALAVPTGTVLDFAGSTAPEGYLLCDGSAVSRIDYASLFAVIGTTHGVGDGSTTFNLPSAAGRMSLGVDGTHALASTGGAATVTLSSSEIPSHTHAAGSFAVGSESAHTHSTPAHSHSISQVKYYSTTGAHSHDQNAGYLAEASNPNTGAAGASTTASDGSGTSGAGTSHTHSFSGTSGSTGSGGAHQNLPPYLALTKIVKI